MVRRRLRPRKPLTSGYGTGLEVSMRGVLFRLCERTAVAGGWAAAPTPTDACATTEE